MMHAADEQFSPAKWLMRFPFSINSKMIALFYLKKRKKKMIALLLKKKKRRKMIALFIPSLQYPRILVKFV